MPTPIAALRDPANETPPAGSLGLAGCETPIVARARDALAAARAESLGDAVTGLGDAVTGLGDQLQAEARHLGAIHDFRAILIDGAPVGG